MEEDLPPNEFFENFGPDYRLGINAIPGFENRNTREQLEKVGRRGQPDYVAGSRGQLH